MKRLLLLCIIAFLICLSPKTSIALSIDSQKFITADSTLEQSISMHDGSLYVGYILETNDKSLIFKTKLSQFEIQFEDIKEISGFKGNNCWYKDLNYSRLFFSPTGKTLPNGKGYIIDYYLFFPGFAIGLTDNITIGGGMSFFPGISIDEQIYYFTPKIGIIQLESYSFAVSAFMFKFPKEEEEFGLLFGMNTYQKNNLQITAGLGYGYSDGEIINKPAVILGCNYRLSEQVAFISENWFMPSEDDPLVSYGVRFLGDKIAVDLGLFTVLDDDPVLPGIIYGNFAFHF